MFVAVAAFVMISGLQSTEVPLAQNSVAKEHGEAFVNVITLSVKGGEGFSYNYTFPKNIYGLPYRINFGNINQPNATILLEWEGNYGNFSYQYDVPKYNYKFSGSCLADEVLNSSDCTNLLMLNNDGENLTLTQLT